MIARVIPLVVIIALSACTTTSGVRMRSDVMDPNAPGEPIDLTMGLRDDPSLRSLISDISPARIRETDSMLVTFGTRHTMSDTMSATRGIGAARHYLYQKLTGYSKACGNCLRVEYDPAMIEVTRHPQKPVVNVVNVLAWLPGSDTSRVIVIGGHYDSCICNVERFDATSDAPGADDDGSGTSAVVELARVFSQRYPHGLNATIIFALYSGEEMGLLGSTHLAQRLHDASTR
jgi:Predicted aminopeptidases